MKRTKNVVIIFGLLLLYLSVSFAHIRSEPSSNWSCVISVSELSGDYDSIIFGEGVNASDGIDGYDVPNPPPPPPPMIDAYFYNASQPIPYNKLMEDWRYYSTLNVKKEWTILILWQNTQNTTVTLTWNMSDLQQSEYNYIVLYDTENDYTLNMLENNAYPFQMGSNEVKELTITAKQDLAPPSIGTPSQNPLENNVQPDQPVTVSVDVADADSVVREVVLSHSTDGGTTWTDVTLSRTNGNTYVGQIPGYPAGTNVQYKITAYDGAGNHAVNDKAGQYWIYTVIPEFPTLPILLLTLILLTVTITLIKKKTRLSSKW